MSIKKITITAEGDVLVLPKHTGLMFDGSREHPPRLKPLSDEKIRDLKLGEYPVEGMFASNPRAMGSPREYHQFEILGEHKSCGKNLDLKEISETHQAIVCDTCHLRVPIPIKVKTYGELQKHMAKFADTAKTKKKG